MSAAKPSNVRFSFLLKLKCDHNHVETVVGELPGGVMAFAQAETCWIHIAIDPASKPVGRNYFRGEHKGAKILGKALATLLEETSSPLIEPTLKQLAADPNVAGLNESATAWLSQNRASAAIAVAVENRSDPKDSLFKQLKLDFLKLLAASDPRPTAAQFMNSFYERGNPESYLEVSVNLAAFTQIRNNYLTHTCAARKEKPMRETLQEFCETHPLPASIPSASAVTTRHGFKRLVEAIAKNFLLRSVKKMRTVWFYGSANCGKTTMTELLAEIFLAQTMDIQEGRYTELSAEHDFATQLVILDEASFGLFAKGNMEKVKKFFEGRGYPHRVMNQTPVTALVGACVFLATNGLPDVSDPLDKDHRTNWLPITYRTSFFEARQSHAGTTKFPFDATVLAHAIMETVTQHEPPLTQSSQLEPFEEEKRQYHLPNVPDFPSSQDSVLGELLG